MIFLSKPIDRDFSILNLTDIHLTEKEWSENHPFRRITTETIKTLVSRVHPDLITISGDLTMVNNRKAYQNLARFLETFEIPWAPIWGNHDNENPPEVIAQVVQDYRHYRHFIYESGDPALGNGNYVIVITERGRPITGLICLDSHEREMLNGESVYPRLYPEQIAWYRDQVQRLKAIGCPESLMLLHIPIYAYNEAFLAAFQGNYCVDCARKHPDIFFSDACWREEYRNSSGMQLENISSYPAEDGVFKVIKELNHTKAVLAGHDHLNNWMIRYQGVRLMYALKTGPSAYWTPEMNGGTVIRISSEGIRTAYHEFVKME